MTDTSKTNLANNKHFALIILDGWGIGRQPEADAIFQADTPFFDQLIKEHPHNTLVTYGQAVGLPEGQMGNSEVGHLNIGAGRVVYQELLKINRSIEEGSFFQNKTLLDAIHYAETQDKDIHLIGLVSDGGVHSHIRHLKALIDLIKLSEIRAYIHAFTDGRDVDPHSSTTFLRDILDYTKNTRVELASVIGRYYAMDRDKRWKRTKKAYELLLHAQGKKTTDVLKTIQSYYDRGITDEFLEAISLRYSDGEAVAKIKQGDVVIFFNIRTDRPRQLTEVLTQYAVPDFGLKPMNLYFLSMTPYDDHYKNVYCIFNKEKLQNTIGQILEQNNRTQLRIAETEKYAHVTYFLNGGREEKFVGELRSMIPSPKVATYDLKPEMSAEEVTRRAIEVVDDSHPHFICLNYANTDMVGHTGVFQAAMQAAETVDSCLARLVPKLLQSDYEMLIIADHGNSDLMIHPDGSPHTAHTKNPVPIIFVSAQDQEYKINCGTLSDIAPTILSRMDIVPPKEMTGQILIQKK